MHANVPSKVLDEPFHLTLPNRDPKKLAAVSPTPIELNPANNGNILNCAESVTSQGEGWIQIGKDTPTSKYIGVNATRPVSFSSLNTS